MKKTTCTHIAAAALALMLSTPVVSAQPLVGGSAMDGMRMAAATNGTMIMLKGATVDGVNAMPHLKDIAAAMAKHGSSKTHHLMVKFTAADNDRIMSNGKAAVKVIGPDGTVSSPVMMMHMEGSFGADLELPAPGNYTFEVGTKLDDGKKRVFRFHYTNTGGA